METLTETGKKPAKKRFLIIVIILVLLLAGVVVYFKFRKPKELTQEEIIQKQIQELDALRQQAGAKPLTQEEIKKQIQELDKLRQQSLGK
ncbi:MAG: hypothetical protein HY773_00965 [Candidatus Terrybacteria bacterium]|nr:hypothetical protein [Candidatus Terrybacteria bacterium]